MNIRKVGKILVYVLAGFVCFVLLALIAIKLALDRVPRYQEEIKAWVFRVVWPGVAV